MIEFLIKSAIVMAVLLGLYYLLFEREKMHNFNRFYLLSALVVSLALPFITVITYIKKVEVSARQPFISSPVTTGIVAHQPIDYWFYIGWGIYFVTTLILSIRFIRNVIHFAKKASVNPKVTMGRAKLILLEEKTLPHTFLNYIFINRMEHESRLIEEELYTHELTHVRQRHTLDILCIEALKTIFWFNPLLYFYKKAIQLNHEFLADEKVIDTTANTVYYQSLLLEKATVGTTFSMASNLTFSLTKKRFLMMTKTTSTKKAGFLKAAIIPVFTALLMLICSETVAQESPKKETAKIPDRIDVTTPTKEEFKALKKADPVKYTGTHSDYLKTTVSYSDKKNDTVTYDRKTPYPGEKQPNLSEFSKIDSNSIESIEILQLTELEKTTLNKIDPEKYNDATLKDYNAIKMIYSNDEGVLVAKTVYEKRPEHY